MDQDDTEKLVFREVKGTSVTTLTSNSKVVDINVHQQALEKLLAGDLTDTSHIIEIRWDTQYREEYPSRCVITIPDKPNDAAKEVLRRLTDNRYNELQSMIVQMYQMYNTRVSYIHVNPLTIGFVHRGISDFKQQREGIESVRWVPAVLTDYPRAQLVMTLESSESLCEASGQNTDAKCTSDPSKMTDNCRLARGNKSMDFDPVDDGTERQFQEIERQIQMQKERMNARLQHQQADYEQMNASVQKLLKLVEEGQKREIKEKEHKTSSRTLDTVSESTAAVVAIPGTPPGSTGQIKGMVGKDERTVARNEASDKILREASGNTKASQEATKFSVDTGVSLNEEANEENKNSINDANQRKSEKDNRYKRKSTKPYEIPTSSSSKGAVPEESVENFLSAVEEARIDDVVMPPYGNGMDTVICVDTSESMGNDGLTDVKQIAIGFVDGIEDTANSTDMEENIAIVKFGGRPRIVHHLSNDYSSIKEKIKNLELGGQTPMLEGFDVAMCALQGERGKVILLRQCHLLSPRLITITDGKPSEGYGHSTDTEIAEQSVKMHFTQMIQKLNSRKNDPVVPKPLVWIPAGQADRKFLQSLAQHSEGIFLEGKHVKTLCKYQQIQDIIAKIYSCLLIDGLEGTDDQKIGVAFDIFAAGLNSEDRNYISKAVRDKMDGKDGSGNPTIQDNDFHNVRELTQLPPLGSRVVRGPHWEHGDQDGKGPGTVYQHAEDEGPDRGVLSVHWDTGNTCKYNYGRKGCYDVQVVRDQPRNTVGDHIDIGCEVTRGPDWKPEYMEQDGGDGCVGVVVRKDNHNKVKVRWRENFYIGGYTYIPYGRREVQLRDPMDIIKEVTMEAAEEVKGHSLAATAGSKTKSWTWKWMDESNNWNEYSTEAVAKLEKSYSKSSTCLIRKGSLSYRVSFKEMVEKSIDDGSSRKVQRSCVDE